MKLLINKSIYGWKMTGLLGRNAKWFLGFSRRYDEAEISRYANQVVMDNSIGIQAKNVNVRFK